MAYFLECFTSVSFVPERVNRSYDNQVKLQLKNMAGDTKKSFVVSILHVLKSF